MDNDAKKENQEAIEAIVDELKQSGKQVFVVISDQDSAATNAMLGMYGNDMLILNVLAGVADRYTDAFKHFLTLYMSKQLVDYLKQYEENQEEEPAGYTDDFDFSEGK